VESRVHLRALHSFVGPPLLTHRPELAAAFPHAGHSLPQFFVRDVEIPLRLFDVGMAEHQLDGADVYAAIREEATSPFVTHVSAGQSVGA